MSGWFDQGISGLQQLKGQFTEFTKEVLQESTEEVKDSQAELYVANQKIKDLEASLRVKTAEVDRLRSENVELRERTGTAELQLHDLMNKYRHLKDHNKSTSFEDIATMSPSKSVPLMSPISMGPVSGSEWSDEIFEVERLKDELKQARAEIEHWKGVVKGECGSGHANNNPDDAALREKIQELQERLRNEREKHEEELAAMQNHYEASSARKADSDNGWDDWQDENGAGGSSDVEGNEPRRARFSIDMDDETERQTSTPVTNAHVDELREEQARLSRLVESFKNKAMSMERAKAEVESRLSQTSNDLESRNAEIAELQAAVEQLDAERENEVSLLVTARDSANSHAKELSAELTSAKQRQSDLEGQIALLKLERDQAQEALNAAQEAAQDKLKAVELELSNCREQLLERESEIGDQKNVIDGGAAKTTKLAEDLERLSAENKDLKAQVSASTEEMRPMQSGDSNEVDRLNSEIEQLEARLERTMRENKEIAAAYTELNEEFEKHKTESSGVVESKNLLRQKLEALQTDLAEYEEKYEFCKSENRRAAEQLDTLTRQLDKLRVEFANTQRSSNTQYWQTEIDKLSTQLMESVEKRESLLSKMATFQEMTNDFAEQVTFYRSENERLRDLLGESGEGGVIEDGLREAREEVQKLKDVVDNLLAQRSNPPGVSGTQAQAGVSQEGSVAAICELNERNESLRKELGEAIENNEQSKTAIALLREKAIEQSEGMERGARWLKGYRKLFGDDESARLEKIFDATIDRKPNFNLRAITYDGDSEQPALVSQLPQVWGQPEETSRIQSNVVEVSDKATTTPRDNDDLGAESGSGDEVRLLGKVASLEMQLVEAQEEITRKTLECQQLNSQLAEVDQMEFTNENLLRDSISEVTEMQDKIREYEDEINQFQERLTKLSDEKTALQNELSSLAAERNAAQELARTTASEYEAYVEKTALREQKFEERLGQLENRDHGRIEQLENELVQERSLLEAKIMEIEELRSNNDTLKAAQENLEAGSSSDLEAALERGRALVDTKASEISNLQLAVEAIESAKTEAEAKVEQLNSALKQKEAQISEFESKITSLEQEMTSMSSQVIQFDANRSAFEAEREKLIGMVNAKHEENVSYYTELQKVHGERAELATKLELLSQELNALKEAAKDEKNAQPPDGQTAKLEAEVLDVKAKLAEAMEKCLTGEAALAEKQSEMEMVLKSKDKVTRELAAERDRATMLADTVRLHEEKAARYQKELERLRQHLLQVEESYTEEALRAENREVELKERLNRLEESYQTESTVAHDDRDVLKSRVEDLEGQLSGVTADRDRALGELAQLRTQLESNEKALANLQGVLQHFQQERDSRVMEEVERYKRDIKRINREKSEMESEKMKLLNDLKSAQEALAISSTFTQQIEDRDAKIANLQDLNEDLQNQVAHVEKRLANLSNSQAKGVDKELLKNLFLGYCVAPDNKRPEIAHLIGSVLGFGQEEFKKVNEASGAGSSWIPFFGRGTAQSPALSGQSIAEQFVSFLESESRPSPSGVALSLASAEGEGKERRSSTASASSQRHRQYTTDDPRDSPQPAAEQHIPTTVELPTFTSSAAAFLRDSLS